MDPVVLRTERLLLDQPGPDDVDRIAEYCADPIFEHYLSGPWPYTRADAIGYLGLVESWWVTGAEPTWALRHPARGFLGMVGFGITREGDTRVGSIGYWLGAPHRGQGFLPEAARTVIDWAFDGRVDRMTWEAVLPNRSSLESARKLGFQYTGIAPAEIAARDGSHPDAWHGELLPGDRDPKPGWP